MKVTIPALLPFLIITVCCVGAVEILYRFLEGKVLVSQAPKTAVVQQPEGKEPRSDTKKRNKNDELQLILQRKLFAPSLPQQDSPKTAPETSAPGKSSLNLVLMGTIIGRNGEERAIIMDKSNKKQELYHKGEYIQGAEIQEINRGKVILNNKGREEILDIIEAAQYTVKVPVAAAPEVRQAPPALPGAASPTKHVSHPGQAAPSNGQPFFLPEPVAPGEASEEVVVPVETQTTPVKPAQVFPPNTAPQ